MLTSFIDYFANFCDHPPYSYWEEGLFWLTASPIMVEQLAAAMASAVAQELFTHMAVDQEAERDECYAQLAFSFSPFSSVQDHCPWGSTTLIWG